MTRLVERRAIKIINEELKKPHHPFLDTMRDVFSVEQYSYFLSSTKEKLGTLYPQGELPLYDSQVDEIIHEITQSSAQNLSDGDIKEIQKAASFAIWAHATNPNIKKRFRHETKSGSDEHQPYSIHLARVAKRVSHLDAKSISLAFLHDVTEDTPYSEEDLKHLFGYDMANLVTKAKKISTDKLEDIHEVEIEVAYKFLSQFKEDRDVENLLDKLQKDVHSSWDFVRNESLGEFEKSHAHELLPGDAVRTLQEYASTQQDMQMLTILRLLSVIQNQEDVRVLLVKCSDVADNMATIGDLATAKGLTRAKEKAELALRLFAPLAHKLGIDSIAHEIEEHAYPIVNSSEAQKVKEKAQNVVHISRQNEKELEDRFRTLKAMFMEWTKTHYSIPIPDESLFIQLRYPTLYEISSQKLPLKYPMAPIVEFICVDSLVRIALEKYFTSVQTYDVHISLNMVKLGETGKLQKNALKMLYGGNLHLSHGLIKEDSGDVVDIFNPKSTQKRINNGIDKLALLQRGYQLGDVSGFIEELRTNTKVVTVITEGVNYSRSSQMYLPKDATLEDSMVTTGYIGYGAKVTRNGQIMYGSDLRANDIVTIVPASQENPSVCSLTYDLIDDLTTPRSLKKIDAMLKDVFRSDDEVKKENLNRNAFRRGVRIFSRLSDSYLIKQKYGDPRQGGDLRLNEVNDEFWETIYDQYNQKINGVNEQYLTKLGMTLLPFPKDRMNLNTRIYNAWLGLEDTQERVISSVDWISQNCFSLNIDTLIKPDYVEVAAFFRKLAGQFILVEYVDPGDTSGYKRYKAFSEYDPPQIPSWAQETKRIEIPSIQRGVVEFPLGRNPNEYNSSLTVLLDRDALEMARTFLNPSNTKDFRDTIHGLLGVWGGFEITPY